MNEGQRSATKGIDGARPRLRKRLGRPLGQQQVNDGRRRSSLAIGVEEPGRNAVRPFVDPFVEKLTVRPPRLATSLRH